MYKVQGTMEKEERIERLERIERVGRKNNVQSTRYNERPCDSRERKQIPSK